MSKILFLTFNDAPGGIYFGQVSDVCAFLESELKQDVILCPFISIRNYKENKKRLEQSFHSTEVHWMFPRIRNWKMNRSKLRRIIRRNAVQTIIARGPFAACLALDMKKEGRVTKVIFDARGAYQAETEEYNVIVDQQVRSEVRAMEKRSLFESDRQLAVSNQLVKYWKEKFDFHSKDFVVIPCTLNSTNMIDLNEQKILHFKQQHGINGDDILCVYSGSFAGWQSLDEYGKFSALLKTQPAVKFLFLSRANDVINKLAIDFPGRVIVKWLDTSEVASALSACDHGWLVRESSVTNSVASPVKFAEYLSAGLKVIISDSLGDLTSFVEENDAGITWKSEIPGIRKVNDQEKKRMRELAKKYFMKSEYKEEYKRLLS